MSQSGGSQWDFLGDWKMAGWKYLKSILEKTKNKHKTKLALEKLPLLEGKLFFFKLEFFKRYDIFFRGWNNWSLRAKNFVFFFLFQLPWELPWYSHKATNQKGLAISPLETKVLAA